MKEIYLTNGLGEDTGHVDAESLNKLNLKYDEKYFPLTKKEFSHLREIKKINGIEFYGNYTTLRGKMKYHCPTFEIPFKDDFWGEDEIGLLSEKEAYKKALYIKSLTEEWARQRNGFVLIEDDMPARISVRVIYPLK